MNIIKKGNRESLNDAYVEVVERKGAGHPDTICDSIVNQAANTLHDKYLAKCHKLYHYNLDKAYLIAGQCTPEFGKLKDLDSPIRLILGDRATPVKEFDVNFVIENEAYMWFAKNVPLLQALDDKNLYVESAVNKGSSTLTGIFKGKGGFDYSNVPANDTSATVGYAPFSDLELAVKMYEDFLKNHRIVNPAVGLDTKIMTQRIGETLNITVASAMIASMLNDMNDYIEAISKLETETVKYFERMVDTSHINVVANALDKPSEGIGGVYITNTGLSAESGDSGQVGRGNNVEGFIPLMRPSSAEADAGKNAYSHIGKIYNRLGFDIAYQIWEEMGIENYIWMVSRIGDPVTLPHLVYVESIKALTAKEEVEINEIIQYGLETIGTKNLFF